MINSQLQFSQNFWNIFETPLQEWNGLRSACLPDEVPGRWRSTSQQSVLHMRHEDKAAAGIGRLDELVPDLYNSKIDPLMRAY